MHLSLLVQEFFERLERGSETLDLEVIGSQYADTFMFGDPTGVRVIEKNKFLPALPKRREFFKSLGHISTKTVALDETESDDNYVLVRAHFLMRFEKASAEPRDIPMDSVYVLYRNNESLQIVMHIEHEDLTQAMQAPQQSDKVEHPDVVHLGTAWRARGLLPGKE